MELKLRPVHPLFPADILFLIIVKLPRHYVTQKQVFIVTAGGIVMSKCFLNFFKSNHVSDPIDILLVENNIDDAELTIRELKRNKMGNKLVHVQDGEEALEYIFATGKFADRNISHTPKLILLDIQMPKVDGIEVLQNIKSDHRTKGIPVVMLTSSNQDPDIKKCYNLGANSYIVKPVNFEAFKDAIQNLGFYWLLLNQPST